MSLPSPDVPTEPADGPPDPAVVVQCAGCGVVVDRSLTSGWVVAICTHGGARPHRFGACPACVTTRYTFAVSQSTEYLADRSRGSVGSACSWKPAIPNLLGLETPGSGTFGGREVVRR